MEFWGITLSEWADICIVTLTIIAITISLFTYFHNKKFSKISVRPNLDTLGRLDFGYDDNQDIDFCTYTYKIRNTGLGPARFENIKLITNNEVIAENNFEHIQSTLCKILEDGLKNTLRTHISRTMFMF